MSKYRGWARHVLEFLWSKWLVPFSVAIAAGLVLGQCWVRGRDGSDTPDLGASGLTPVVTNVRSELRVDVAPTVEGRAVRFAVAIQGAISPTLTMQVDGLEGFTVTDAVAEGVKETFVEVERLSPRVALFSTAPQANELRISFVATANPEITGYRSFSFLLGDQFGAIPPVSASVYVPQFGEGRTVGRTTEFQLWADKIRVRPGEEVTFYMAITNATDHQLSDALVWLNPLVDWEYVEGSARYRGTGGIERELPEARALFGDHVNFGVVPPGKAITITYRLRAREGIQDGAYIWSVASFKARESSEPQVASFAALVVQPSMVLENLELRPEGENSFAVTARVTNDGSAVLNNVTLAVSTPDGVTIIPRTTSLTLAEQTITVDDGWAALGVNLGNVNPSQKAELRFSVASDPKLQTGERVVTVFARSDELPDWIQTTGKAP